MITVAASRRTADLLNTYYRKSGVPVLILIKLRGIKATCIISGDRGQPCVSSYCEQQKPRQWPANKASEFVCYC